MIGINFGKTKVLASSGNRTRAARVAGEHSTTEPTMLTSKIDKILNGHNRMTFKRYQQKKRQVGDLFGHFGMPKNCIKGYAVGRIRTYAPRGKLISSQSP